MAKYILKSKKLKKLSLLIIILPLITFANVTVKNNPIVGGIAVIDFYTNNSNPKAFYNGIPLYTHKIKDKKWQVLVGIPLLTKPGIKKITIENNSTVKDVTFNVLKHKYKEQYITLSGKNKKYVNPNLKHIERIKKERIILTKARKQFSNKNLANGSFINPVDGIVTGEFGFRRFYNNEPRRPHTGIDYAGSIGTKIKAAATGKVILVGNFFFNGNTVFLDHGKGLISVYIHMDKILVKQGQSVKQGDFIGTIGSTGRSTGPHLHWGIYLNQTAVNPNLLL
jgi:murein DD-endopeptidase MepM/ murein hydrolase activator NlpD